MNLSKPTRTPRPEIESSARIESRLDWVALNNSVPKALISGRRYKSRAGEEYASRHDGTIVGAWNRPVPLPKMDSVRTIPLVVATRGESEMGSANPTNGKRALMAAPTNIAKAMLSPTENRT